MRALKTVAVALGVTLAAQEWRARSRPIAFRRLDLHDVGAEMTEKLRRVRRSDQFAALEDANAAERSRGPCLLAAHPTPSRR